ncbi:hypothetical protein BGP84_15440 [Pseudomonas putida]|jgi:hypothetical protein|uniref:Uncharacterized protein n=1 Tax=Pseudomonas putida TaxID=303 RepID=A0A2S3X683_PSEPU|nr:hypothetical protein [Pseudomonas putida]POG11057.1 hypothetical protein BGP84_15440 [Pseudomonas putida]POG15032.1 hypothetical protein BGP85_02285 [Pseudomonas putida]
MVMQTRFVVVPALPQEKECLPRLAGFPKALGNGYDLYDTIDKLRLVLNFSTRAEADYACACRNGLLGEREDSASGGRSGWCAAET